MPYDVVFSHDGDSINYTPSSDVVAGQVVVLGSAGLIGVARRPIPANTLGSLWLVGCYDFPKSTASSSGQVIGTLMYWDATNSVATPTSSGNTRLGYQLVASADADTTARIRMNVN